MSDSDLGRSITFTQAPDAPGGFTLDVQDGSNSESPVEVAASDDLAALRNELSALLDFLRLLISTPPAEDSPAPAPAPTPAAAPVAEDEVPVVEEPPVAEDDEDTPVVEDDEDDEPVVDEAPEEDAPAVPEAPVVEAPAPQPAVAEDEQPVAEAPAPQEDDSEELVAAAPAREPVAQEEPVAEAPAPASAPETPEQGGLPEAAFELSETLSIKNSGDVVSLRGEDLLQISEGTISFSFTAEEVEGRLGLLSRDAKYFYGDGNHLSIFIEDGSLKARLQDGEQQIILTSEGISAGTEYHVALTFDGEAARISVDGALQDEGATNMTWETSDEFVQIGALGWLSKAGADGYVLPFEGEISDVAIFDQALSQADIAILAGVVPPPVDEEPIEEPVDEPADDPVEEPADEPADDPVEEPADEPADDPVEEPVDEPADDPVEEPVDEPADDPSRSR